jgi:hypothetical protein
VNAVVFLGVCMLGGFFILAIPFASVITMLGQPDPPLLTVKPPHSAIADMPTAADAHVVAKGGTEV